MKETSFISENKDKWSRFEKLYTSKSKDPEELSDLYMDITDDLSYAQTFYKRRTVRVYLNQLAQTVFSGVHKQKGESLKRFFTIWQKSLPLEIYRSRKNLLFALVCLLIYGAIGAITTYVNPEFPRLVMGNEYVEMTLQNIANGKPLNVYAAGSENFKSNMFYGITTNNIKVAFLTFFLGFFFTIGTHVLLFSNGVMLGAFQSFFYLKGVLVTSFLGIWIHGAFEISAIVIAAGAGITAGNGWLFPKSYSRLQSLQLSTRRGLKIMLSLVPFLIFAGFLESYVTRHNQTLSEFTKWFLIIFCFAIILFVYVFYPMYVARKYPELVDQQVVDVIEPRPLPQMDKAKNFTEIFSDGAYIFRVNFGKYLKYTFFFIFPFIAILVVYRNIAYPEDIANFYWYDWYGLLEYMIGFSFKDSSGYFSVVIWTVFISMIVTFSFYFLKKMQTPDLKLTSYFKKHFLRIFTSTIVIVASFFLVPYFMHFFIVFLMPFFLENLARAALSDNYKWSFLSLIRFKSYNYGSALGFVALLYLCYFVFAQPIAFVGSIHQMEGTPAVGDLLDMMVNFINRVAVSYSDTPEVYGMYFRQFVYIVFILITIPFCCYIFGLFYLSEREKRYSFGLKAAFKNFGKRSRTSEKEADYV